MDTLFLTVSETKEGICGGAGIRLLALQRTDTDELDTRGTLKRLLELGLADIRPGRTLNFFLLHTKKHFVSKELCTDGANAVMGMSVRTLGQQGLRAPLYCKHGPCTGHAAGGHLILTTTL